MITTDTGTGTSTASGTTAGPGTSTASGATAGAGTVTGAGTMTGSGVVTGPGTVTGADTVILPEDALDPYVTHPPTRRRLTGPGLPADSDLLTFGALRAATRVGGPRTVAEVTGDPARLPADLRDQLVIGALRAPAGPETESVLLDGATGEVSTARLLPGPADRLPLAPSLRTLADFMTATHEMAGRRGRFASYEGRFGPKAVTGMSRRLLALFEEGADGEVPPFRRAAALIRPLALVAGPPAGAALTLDLPDRLLDREFGRGRVMRFEDVDFPAALTHEPTRRFLRETGLPEDGPLFHLDTDVPLPTLAEYYEDERPYVLTPDRLPADGDRLIRLGGLAGDDSLVVDGATGAILEWSEPDATLYALNADVSTLAFTLWLLHRERTIDASLSREPAERARGHLSTTTTQTLAAVDPTGLTRQDGRPYWTRTRTQAFRHGSAAAR